MVRQLFGAVPDPDQERALALFPTSPRLALKACVGVGKTTTLAWLIWNFMLTRPFAVGAATSISRANLKGGLWKELAKWRDKAPLLRASFEMTGDDIYERKHPDTWRFQARSWSKDANAEQMGNTLAGIHGDYVLFALDETGAYPDSILPTAEAIFSGNPTEAHIVQAGNPSHRSGPLFRACHLARNLWDVIEITGDPDNPNRSDRIPIEYAREQIAQYGRDNEWVKVKIFGEFPSSNPNALISDDEVRAAMRRYYRPYEIGNAPKIVGVDVAAEGDDQSVIFCRHGIQAAKMEKYRNIDSTAGAGQVARRLEAFGADACFIDNTGGFGAGWADQLIQLHYTPIRINFSSRAGNPELYGNKRSEMYFEACEWIKRGGALPEDAQLLASLPEMTYYHQGNRMFIEPKADIKKRLGYSPDEADAFVLTFAGPVQPKEGRRPAIPVQQQPVYDPFAEAPRQRMPAYDPFR